MVEDGRAEGSSARGDGGQAAASFPLDADGTGSGSLLDSVQSTLLTKRFSDVCIPPVMSGLGVKILYYHTLQYCTASTEKHSHLQSMHARDDVRQTRELTYVIGHTNVRLLV